MTTAGDISAIETERRNLQQYPELERDEVAKLLLLSAKAFTMKRITRKQKDHLKDQICLRLGYLRIILEQTTNLDVTIGALIAVAGDP